MDRRKRRRGSERESRGSEPLQSPAGQVLWRNRYAERIQAGHQLRAPLWEGQTISGFGPGKLCPRRLDDELLRIGAEWLPAGSDRHGLSKFPLCGQPSSKRPDE